jgi:single-stranded-DNA-specific exonuclease
MDSSVRRFDIAACPPGEVARLQRELGVSEPLAQVLVRRGLGEPADARAFLAAEEEHEPAAFNGLERAIEPLLRHLASGTRITIHGDYDVDGVCSTAVLVRALRELGANVDWYLPDRATDGYGLNLLTVERLAARGTRLLVTVDCAITAVKEVLAAKALGMEVLVSDHHAPRADGVLPDAPIVHPVLCDYPCRELCATAVAYKLAQALRSAAGHASVAGHASAAGDMSAADHTSAEQARRDSERDLDLVALATIADVVPLIGENRTLVRRGLGALARTAKPGLRALMAVARVDANKVNERAVAFALAPRLNAAGRLYRADAGLELILTEDPVRAAQIAEELDRANHERRDTERRILFEAEAQVAKLNEGVPPDSLTDGGSPHAYVLGGEGWHPGVIGIVASRIAERHHRPTVLIALEGESGRGSARSIEAFDLLGGLTACGAHLLRYGGHRAAAGLEIERSRMEEFVAAFCAHAEETLALEDLRPVERVDAVVTGDQLGMKLAEELTRLAPFGRGNPTVSLLLAAGTFEDARPMGEGRHVRFTVESAGARARAVAFGNGGALPVADGVPVDATFTLEVNEWNGVSEPRLVLRHAQPCEDPSASEPVTAEWAGEPADDRRDDELALFALP